MKPAKPPRRRVSRRAKKLLYLGSGEFVFKDRATAADRRKAAAQRKPKPVYLTASPEQPDAVIALQERICDELQLEFTRRSPDRHISATLNKTTGKIWVSCDGDLLNGATMFANGFIRAAHLFLK